MLTKKAVLVTMVLVLVFSFINEIQAQAQTTQVESLIAKVTLFKTTEAQVISLLGKPSKTDSSQFGCIGGNSLIIKYKRLYYGDNWVDVEMEGEGLVTGKSIN